MTTKPKEERRPSLSDIDLIRRSKMEDLSAYEQLIRRCYGNIYGLTYGMTSDREDAEALTQDVFIRAWKAMGHFREQSDFCIWIYRIALNRIARFQKHRELSKILQFEEFDPEIKQSDSYRTFSQKGSVLRKMSLSEFQKKMNEALLMLPDLQRAVVIMCEVQKLSFSAVAGRVNGSETVVQSRLKKARESLKAELGESDLSELLALKVFERPRPARFDKNVKSTLLAVRLAHKRPSLLHFPDKSMGWMLAQPRYGIALVFLVFLGLHLLQRPVSSSQGRSGGIEVPDPGEELVATLETNEVTIPRIPSYSSLTNPVPFFEETSQE